MMSRKPLKAILILILLSFSLSALWAEEPIDGETYTYSYPGDEGLNYLEFSYSSSMGGYILTDVPSCSGDLLIPSEINGYSVVEIGSYAFYGNGELKGELYLPSTVRRIGEYAFASCSLTGDIFIPSSVEEIGEGAFYCSSFNGSLYLNDRIFVIEKYAFAYTPLTGSLVMGANVREIREGAFMHCDFSGDLILNEGIESIGEYAFEGNERLDCDLVLPSSLLTLKASAFNYCSGLNGHYIMNDRGSYVIKGLDDVEVNNE